MELLPIDPVTVRVLAVVKFTLPTPPVLVAVIFAKILSKSTVNCPCGDPVEVPVNSTELLSFRSAEVDLVSLSLIEISAALTCLKLTNMTNNNEYF